MAAMGCASNNRSSFLSSPLPDSNSFISIGGNRLFNPALQDKNLEEHLKNHSLGEMIHNMEGFGAEMQRQQRQMPPFSDQLRVAAAMHPFAHYVPAQSPPMQFPQPMPPRPRPEGGQVRVSSFLFFFLFTLIFSYLPVFSSF